jgi:cytochrome oxidase Cu insertion factor (SCO1/SenC/PrrC family)
MGGSRKLFLMLGALIAVLAIVLGTSLWLIFTRRSEFTTIAGERREPLTMYGTVPDFSLTERSGENITLAHLRGKIWIADFIYTTCTDTCPLQTGLMARLQEEYVSAPHVQLVSVTVDPERDTPQTLIRYATRHRADARRWFFLTGQRDRIIRLVRDGFHLSVAAIPDVADSTGVIAHSPRFVLIDKDARIRGYYDSRELEAFLRLKNDIETLLKG